MFAPFGFIVGEMVAKRQCETNCGGVYVIGLND